MNINLSQLLSSASRTSILEVLSKQSEPVPLRQIALLATIHVRSADVTLRQLAKEKIVCSRKVKNEKHFYINRDHEAHEAILKIINLVTAMNISAQAGILRDKAINALQFASSGLEFIQQAKSRL